MSPAHTGTNRKKQTMKQWTLTRQEDGHYEITSDMGVLGYCRDYQHALSVARQLVARHGGTILTGPSEYQQDVMWAHTCQQCGNTDYTDEWNGGEPYSTDGCLECGADQWGPWHDADEPHPAVWQTAHTSEMAQLRAAMSVIDSILGVER